NATSGSSQPRQRMLPSSHSGALSIGAGSANDSTSAMVALGSSSRAPSTWISTPRMSGLASVFIFASSRVPVVRHPLRELRRRPGLGSARDRRAGSRIVETFLGRLAGDQGAGGSELHHLVHLGGVS